MEALERVLELRFTHADQREGRRTITLVLELMGRRSNMILVHEEVNDDQGIREAMLAVPGTTAQLQLMAPLDDSSTIAKFMEKRGPGIQQMAVRVSDLDTICEQLREQGVRLVYDAARRGTANSRINFIHPKDAGGVLIELVEPAS